jgi:hypothetical protein
MLQATPTKSDRNATSFSFPAVHRKKVTAAFDGGRITSDGGVLLLAQAERAMGICAQLAGCIADPRDPTQVIHALPDTLRARVLAIGSGYEDADDLDTLCDDPVFRLALGKLPETGAGLASQPTMSRWENAPTTRELARMMSAMVAVFCASYRVEPTAVTLDIDDTCDVVHGTQQLSFWNGHYGERCFLPIHVYDTATGRPVAMLPRTSKTPTGAEADGSAAWCGGSVGTGPRPTSRSGAMGIMAAPRSWHGARQTASIMSLACPPTRSCVLIR